MKIATSKERLQALLDYYGYTQSYFCKRTGITTSALSNYLHGSREPRQDKIVAIADTFGIDPAWLMGYDVPMKKEPPSTDRLLAYYKKLCLLNKRDQEMIFNQIDYLGDMTYEN